MDRRGIFGRTGLALTALLLSLSAPAVAQFSDSYNFLKAIRDRDGAKVSEFIEGPSGGTLINTKDYSAGEGALHIIAKRHDDLWLRYLLAKGANPNIRDKNGNTPLILCAQIGFLEGIDALIGNRADVNLANDNGETPLIIAVQRRDMASTRMLLAAGANTKRQDHIAGLSAHDYAARDTRSGAILRLIEDAEKAAAAAPKPKVAGPGL